jgi:GMP synthase-like glutamine amidotransferase
MRAHYLQHVAFEGPGSIEPWLAAAGYGITGTRLFESARLPAVNDVDLLVVMGGPMSVNDEDDFPWLAAEKRFIRDAIRSGKPVLGVCLGAQLIASALGARVYPNSEKEIGWFPVRRVPSAGKPVFRFPDSADVFHWHGETFDLPPEAILLASSEGCAHQAFQLGRAVIGLQFHLESTPDSVRDIVAHCRPELRPARYVQTEREILAAPPARYRAINALMGDVLSYLTGVHSEGCADLA